MMSREIKERQLSMAWLNHQRMLLGIGATIYFAWWFVVDQLLPSSFNPFMSRLVVSFGMLATLGLSFVTVFVRRHFDIFYSICAYALILHYFYLFYHNPSDINWLVGSYVAVVTVGSTFETRSKLIGFSIIVIAVTAYVAFHESSILVAVPGMFTIYPQ